ncbi:MAG TPA: SUF system NifU family Fe-S cluster assembly protein [Patescibacteria group bacterium]|nr:SUF system NifU family Fe-S cluster assembly protein [Patescibacteria group bacterium]
MDDLYRELILDHYKDPRNFGSLDSPDASHEEDNPLCGDRIRMEIKLSNDKLSAVRFSGEGCAISMASASLLTEAVDGKKIKDLQRLDKDDIVSLLGNPILTPTRLKCALLPLEVLQRAIQRTTNG